jgi:hypothetical protein
MNQCVLHFLQTGMLPPPLHFSTFPSSQALLLKMNDGNDNHVLIFTNDKCFGFAGICKRGLQGNKTASRRQEALNVSSPQFTGLLFVTSVESN